MSAIQIGRAQNSDKTVALPTFEFRPNDTIYVAVVTTGKAENALIRVQWSYGGGTVSDAEQRVSHREQGVTGFELRNAGGFPPGTYKLEVFLDGAPAATREVRVKN